MGPFAWLRRTRPASESAARWVVVDVESSGLDPQRDRLLAIAAVGVQWRTGRPCIGVADSYEVLLQQPALGTEPDRANILVHGIGLERQVHGVEPADALRGFIAFVADAPLVAFHAPFDRVLLSRALRATLDLRLTGPWLDLADLAPVVVSGLRARALDDWLAHFDIRVGQRHLAAADAWATAELLQRLWPLAQAQACGPGFEGLARLAASRRWLDRN